MRRSPLGSLAASPTMVGAVTTLIVIVAVFLAYNANSGLPFVPTYRVSVEVPDAARLTSNNEVRIGGHRVGVVESVEIARSDDATATAQADGDSEAVGNTGGAIAELNLKLEKDIEPLPQDSIFRVRYRSSFGLKYLEIIRGTGEPAEEGFTFDGTDDGATCELPMNVETFSQTVADSARNGCFQQQTEFDDIANTFDAPTRENSRTALEGFGTAFAGRGTSLNDAISSLEPLFRGLRPVARVLTEGPATLETGIETLPAQRAFLADFAVLSRELRPGASALRTTLPVLNEAVEVGTPVLRDTPAMNRRLKGVLGELNQLVSQPTTRLALQRLGDTFDVAGPLAKYVAPAQTVCNYFNYFFTFFSESFSDPDQLGFAYRQMGAGAGLPFEVESDVGGYSGITASGRASHLEGGAFKPFELPIANAGPYMPAGQRNADCQLGQRGYPLGSLPLPGQPANSAANMASDLPGSRGPTTLFYNDEGNRELRDTRVKARAPETWKGLGR